MHSTSPKKGEVSRDKIMAAASTLFLQQGYHATTMRQIVNQAGMTMGGIYNHFGSKEEIWVEVFVAKHPFREMLQVLQTAQGETIAAYVRNAARRMIAVLGERRDMLNFMFIELVEFKGQHFYTLMNAFIPEITLIGQRFNQLQGKPRPLPPLTLARSFIGFFFSYFMTDLILGEQVRTLFTADTLENFVDIYLYGILCEDDPTRTTNA